MIHSNRTATAYRALLIGLCGYAILAYAGMFEGRFNPQVFVYFTILSVLLALVTFLALLIAPRGAREGGRLRAGLARCSAWTSCWGHARR